MVKLLVTGLRGQGKNNMEEPEKGIGGMGRREFQSGTYREMERSEK